MRKTATTFLFVLSCVAASAQRQHVVADMDTRLPLQGAVVATSGGQRLVTDYTGRFHSTLPVTSATVSKKNYMQRRVGTAELQQDTIYLIPQEVVLKEVEVTTPGFSFDTKKALRKKWKMLSSTNRWHKEAICSDSSLCFCLPARLKASHVRRK